MFADGPNSEHIAPCHFCLKLMQGCLSILIPLRGEWRMNTMTGNGAFGQRQSVTSKMIVVLVATAFLLLVPLVAMQFTDEVKWDLFDFTVAGMLLAGTGTVM
jgi:hypothetical protein